MKICYFKQTKIIKKTHDFKKIYICVHKYLNYPHSKLIINAKNSFKHVRIAAKRHYTRFAIYALDIYYIVKIHITGKYLLNNQRDVEHVHIMFVKP